MTKARVLSLDVSSKVGWALLDILSDDSIVRLESGTLEKTNESDYRHLKYPLSYLEWSANTWQKIESLIHRCQPTHLSIEETTIKVTGSNNYSQKFLEWIHYHLATFLIANSGKYEYAYYKTDQWRVIVGCNTMTDEDKKKNKMVRDYKKANPKSRFTYDPEGKRISKVTKKDLNIRKANEVFGLNLIKKNEDEADGILLGYAFAKQIIAQRK